MERTKKGSCCIIAVTVICCIVMALMETLIEPPYAVKSAVKVAVFLLSPLIALKVMKIKLFGGTFAITKKTLLKLLLLGLAIYSAIIGTYFLTRSIFDYAALVDSLLADQKVTGDSFIPIALYISFGNSFLEEFLFRWFAFIKLSEYVPKSVAYIFSSVMFAVYHIAMIGASFPLPLLLLALFGLAVGGAIFDRVDDKSKNIYNSWIIHMFADLAIMTVWYLHI